MYIEKHGIYWKGILRGRAVVARDAHNVKVGSSNLSPATK